MERKKTKQKKDIQEKKEEKKCHWKWQIQVFCVGKKSLGKGYLKELEHSQKETKTSALFCVQHKRFTNTLSSRPMNEYACKFISKFLHVYLTYWAEKKKWVKMEIMNLTLI